MKYHIYDRGKGEYKRWAIEDENELIVSKWDTREEARESLRRLNKAKEKDNEQAKI